MIYENCRITCYVLKENALTVKSSPPSAREFLIETPLYEVVEYTVENFKLGHQIRYFDETFDSYCPQCNTHSIFERLWPHGKSIASRFDSWLDCGVFSFKVQCTRNRSHMLFFVFNAKENTLEKIGQMPSIADLNLFDARKYSKVLPIEYFREFTKAIGLSAHGVGVGSFVYLRRIFEFLIEEAHQKVVSKDGWNEEAYQRSRMAEKIEILQSELPTFLVENKSIYSILSKGIHELSEQECLAAFPAVKVGIEIVLDTRLEEANRLKKLEEAKKAIASLHAKP